MRKILFLTAAILLLLATNSSAMIDIYSYKIVGKVMVKKDGGLMDLKVISILPSLASRMKWIGAEKQSFTDISYALKLESTTRINKLQDSDIIIGRLFTEGVEQHREGSSNWSYLYWLEIEEIIPEKGAQNYFIKKTEYLREILTSGDINAMANVAVIAREFNLKPLLPIILKTLEKYYPKRDYTAFLERRALYFDGLETLKELKYKQALPFLKRVINDKANKESIGADFQKIQDIAQEAVKGF